MNNLYIDRTKERVSVLNILNRKLKEQGKVIIKEKEAKWKKRFDRKVIEEDE